MYPYSSKQPEFKMLHREAIYMYKHKGSIFHFILYVHLQYCIWRHNYLQGNGCSWFVSSDTTSANCWHHSITFTIADNYLLQRLI